VEQVGSTGRLRVDTSDQVRINRLTGEVEVQPRDDLRLRAGMRWAQRDVNVSTATSGVDTSALGAIADVRYRPWTRLSLFARYENAQIDDPYVSAGAPLNAPSLPDRQITLTLVNRGSAGLRLQAVSWAQLQYTFIADSRENSSFDGRAVSYGNNVGVTLEPLPELSIYAGYTFRDFHNDAEILTAPTYDRLTSVQDGTENVLNAQVAYAFGLFGQRWSAGANVLYADGDQKLAPRLEPGAGTRTFYDVARIDGGTFLSLHHRWLEPTLEFRMVDYDERVLPRNDYRATIVVVKVTKRWDN
jgi:hypothetical protein